MQFLWPLTAAVVAAITIPLLLLLYVLKLRRQRVQIASTLLWRKAFQDLQANVPFQRLRWSFLLLLQLLALIALILALAEPLVSDSGSAAARIVLLIDQSASMNARLPEPVDGQPNQTRLDAAKSQAKEIAERINRSSSQQQVMVIAFGASPQIVAPFTSDRASLLAAIDSVQPTDEQGDLEAALQLASAFIPLDSEESADESAVASHEVVLISDGVCARQQIGAATTSAFTLRSGTFRYVPVVQNSSLRNVGIVSLSVRRSALATELTEAVAGPESSIVAPSAQVFMRLINTQNQPVNAVLTILVDDEPVASLRRTLPSATESAVGELTLTQPIEIPSKGDSLPATIRVQHNVQDALAADDVAAAVLPAPSLPRIALVFGGSESQPSNTSTPHASPVQPEPDPFLVELLTAVVSPARVNVLSSTAYSGLNQQALSAGELYDFVVFDRVPPRDGIAAPGVPSLWVGGSPASVRLNEMSGEQTILSWERQHPLMRHVSLDNITFTGVGSLELPAGAEPLAYAADGPIMAVLEEGGSTHVIVGFEFSSSNWPMQVSSAVFLQNVLDEQLAGEVAGGITYRPGQTPIVRARRGATELVVEAARGSSTEVISRTQVAGREGSIALPPIRTTGLYIVQGARMPLNVLAVSMLSDVESDIRPVERIQVSAAAGRSLAAQSAAASGVQALWPWLVALALTVLVIEWLAYCAKARGS